MTNPKIEEVLKKWTQPEKYEKYLKQHKQMKMTLKKDIKKLKQMTISLKKDDTQKWRRPL